MARFGEILAELRLDNQLTQKELAEKLHISNSTISSYETGNRIPEVSVLIEISTFFHVSTDYLLGLTDSPLFPTILSKKMIGDVTYRSVLERIEHLPPSRRKVLNAILGDMDFCSTVQKSASQLEKTTKE